MYYGTCLKYIPEKCKQLKQNLPASWQSMNHAVFLIMTFEGGLQGVRFRLSVEYFMVFRLSVAFFSVFRDSLLLLSGFPQNLFPFSGFPPLFQCFSGFPPLYITPPHLYQWLIKMFHFFFLELENKMVCSSKK